VRYLLLAAALCGCDNAPSDYRLSGGKVVSCRFAIRNNCGMTLLECSDGIDRHCQTNIEGKAVR